MKNKIYEINNMDVYKIKLDLSNYSIKDIKLLAKYYNINLEDFIFPFRIITIIYLKRLVKKNKQS